MTTTKQDIDFAKQVASQLNQFGLTEQFVKSFEAGDDVSDFINAGAAQVVRKHEIMQVELQTRPEANRLFLDAIYDKLAAA